MALSTEEGPITTWLLQRKIGAHKRSRFTPFYDLIQRLKQEASLEGHQGCVNCIEWNQSGNLLASGSDDQTIIIWDPFKRRKNNTVTTSHEGNIFSVKFMPDCCDNVVASCSCDCCVKLTDVLTSKNLLDCRNCHSDRVKRLAIHQAEPNLLWSSGEDGLILQYDIREAHSCRESKPRNILIDLKSIFSSLKAKCLAVNPMRSEMLAVGATDVFNRLFDRRYIKINNKEHSCVRYFAPGHLLKTENRSNHLQSYGTTYLSFSQDGSELLASVHADQVYLFDLHEPWERYKTFDRSLQSILLDRPNVTRPNAYYDLIRVANKSKQTSWKPVHWTKLVNLRQTSQMSEEMRSNLGPILRDFSRREDLKPSRHMFNYINNLLRTTKDCPELYTARAKYLLIRGWPGDYYQSMRDCCCALALDPLNYVTIKCLAETFTKLGRTYSADGLIDFISAMKKHDSPHNQEVQEAWEILQNFESIKPEKMLNCDNNNECDIITDDDLDHGDLLRSFLSGDSPLCTDITGMLFERDRKRNEFKRAHKAYDYTQRYCGHCNMNTDIKEANFFGSDDEYIVGGSDDGAFYVWDKKTGNIAKAVDADYQVLNCVQPHPNICMLATSGVESTVKLWSSSGSVNHDVVELEMRCTQNQKYIASDPLEAMMLMLIPDYMQD